MSCKNLFIQVSRLLDKKLKGDCFIKSYFAKMIVLLALCFCGQAHAQLYLGAGYGISEPTNMGDADSYPETEGDAGYRVYIGNAVSEHVSMEFSYVDLGTYDVGTVDGVPDPDILVDTIAITGSDASFVGKWPWTKYFNIYTRIGLFYWEGERYVREMVDSGGGVMVEQESTLAFDNYDLSLGFGFDYQILRNIGVQLEANAYKTDDVANYLYGLSVYYTF